MEDHFTHEESVRLHLGMISDIVLEDRLQWSMEAVQWIWGEMLNSVAEVKPIFMDWFSDKSNIFGKDANSCMTVILSSCDDAIKQVPGYDKACSVYNV